MKILLITNLFPVPWEEHKAAFNKQQISRLSKLHDIDVLIPLSNMNWFKNKDKPVKKYIANINIFLLPFIYVPKLFRFTQSFLLFFSLLTRYRKIKNENYDCILAYWSYPDSVSAVLLSILLKKKVIIKVFGSDVRLFFNDKLRKRQILWAMNRSSKVLSVSSDIKDKLIAAGISGDKIEVLYDGVDKDIFHVKNKQESRSKLGIDEEREVILFVGNIILTKGVNELYQSFKILANENKLLDLYFVGAGDMRSCIETLSKQDDLADRVVFLGRRSLDEISVVLSSSNLLCLPSYSEGVPNVLLEAKASGVPVVATNVGGVPEIVTSDDGVLVNIKDVNSLVDGLRTCLNADWNCELISQRANEFSWDKNIALLDHEIKSLF